MPPSPAPPALAAKSDDVAGKGIDLSRISTSPRDGSPYLGPKEALVVVNLFTDFQCPVCRRSADPIKQLVVDFPDRVKVVFRNNALEFHGRSRPAALAAMAAGKQGKFWEYHDRIFANPNALDDASLKRTAIDLGLDAAQWEKDVADPKNVERVETETAWAAQLGARGTPGFFINGIRQVGWGSYGGLREMVAREVAESERLAASGTPAAQIPAARIKAIVAGKTRQEGEPDAAAWVKILTAD